MNALVRNRFASNNTRRSTRTGIIRTLLIALVMFAAFSATASAWPIIKIKFGDPIRNCMGVGLCRIDILLSAAEARSTFVIPHILESSGRITDPAHVNSKVTFSLQEPIEGRPEVLPVQEPVTLSPESARAVGAEELVVLPGQYPVDYSTNPNGDITVNVQRMGISVGVQFGRRSRNCKGFGVCSVWVDIDFRAEHQAIASVVGNKIRLRWHGDGAPVNEAFVIDQDITVSPETTRALGLNNLVLKRGAYRVTQDSDGSNVVLLDAEGIHVVVDINFGRRSRDCRGFGICSIVISFDFATALHPASASLVGNELTLRWQDDGTPTEDLLPIDEDIVLDAATAHALGVRGLTLKKGAYRVERDSRGWNTVVIAAARIGITIDIEVGRRSKGCSGFGICSITIGLDLDLKSQQAQAVLNGNTLSLFFANPLPSTEEALVIDEDIVLDSATAHSLGAKSLTVKRGTYNVQRNPDGTSTVEVQALRFGITIHVEVGRKSKGCTGFGICSITIDIDLRTAQQPAEAALKGNTLTLFFANSLPSTEEALVIDEDIVLDPATARALGARELMVKRGTYRVTRNADGTSTVDVQVQRFGVTINVEVGRKSKGCIGFGICSITIDIDLRAAQQPTLAELKGNTLSLTFLNPLPSQEEVLVIDEDITLDPATARALGAKTLTVKHGAYHVRRNADGTVSVDVDVQRAGISLTIYLGLRSQGCRGFGICRVVLEDHFFTSANARTVQTIATLENGLVEFDLIGQAEGTESVLQIDEAIELDSSAAAALGVTALRPGLYPVDYSTNPNGVVRVMGNTESVAGVENLAMTNGVTVVPNPATDNTTFRFTLPASAPVTLTVSDLSGREVARPIDGVMLNAGSHHVNFDASALAAGTYLYTMRVAGGMVNGRLVVRR